jgi:molecular chaperone GrpE
MAEFDTDALQEDGHDGAHDASTDSFLTTALEELQAENAALKEQALRYAAEADNTKRRAEREANDARAFAIQKFGRDLLDAADNLSRAVQHAPKDAADPAVKNLVMGIEMTEKALITAFERNGLKQVLPARGDKFDPHLHQAMMEQPADDVPPGAVVNVMQSGYELFGRILRPAMVIVTPKGASASAASQSGDAYAAAETTGGSVDAKA